MSATGGTARLSSRKVLTARSSLGRGRGLQEVKCSHCLEEMGKKGEKMEWRIRGRTDEHKTKVEHKWGQKMNRKGQIAHWDFTQDRGRYRMKNAGLERGMNIM